MTTVRCARCDFQVPAPLDPVGVALMEAHLDWHRRDDDGLEDHYAAVAAGQEAERLADLDYGEAVAAAMNDEEQW